MDFKKLFYNTVLSQTFSACGEYLFAGNNFGDVFVFRLDMEVLEIVISGMITVSLCPSSTYSVPQIFDTDKQQDGDIKKALEPMQVFKVSEKHLIHSLAFHRNFLIVGTTGEIAGYAWTNDKLGKKLWAITIPSSEDSLGFADVNYLYVDKDKDLLYAGCGDNKIYCVNLDNGQIMRDFNEHKDYIHCVFGR